MMGEDVMTQDGEIGIRPGLAARQPHAPLVARLRCALSGHAFQERSGIEGAEVVTVVRCPRCRVEFEFRVTFSVPDAITTIERETY